MSDAFTLCFLRSARGKKWCTWERGAVAGNRPVAVFEARAPVPRLRLAQHREVERHGRPADPTGEEVVVRQFRQILLGVGPQPRRGPLAAERLEHLVQGGLRRAAEVAAQA